MAPAGREVRREAGVASLYHQVPFAQDASVLMVGERTNANGSKAFREAMLAGDFQKCVEIAREAARDGSHLIDLCVDYVGRDGTVDMGELAGRIASRLIDDLTGRWGMAVSDILIDCLTFPISTGQEETRRDAIETIEAIREVTRRYPGVNFTLGISNISFGLNPAARQVLNSVFLHECQQAGLTSAIVHASKILPVSRIPDEQ